MSEAPRKPRPKAPRYDDQMIFDLCVLTYKERLGPKDTKSMIAKDKDDGTMLANRAQAYAPVVKAVLDSLHQMEANERGL